MKQLLVYSTAILLIMGLTLPLQAKAISGKIVNASGKTQGGVMVSAYDDSRQQSTSVFTQPDGSFSIDGLRNINYRLRTRLMGQLDQWREGVESGAEAVNFKLQPATGFDLEKQRPANSAFSMLKFDNIKDKLNFKMFCSYCHQLGTIGFRTPEEPVDWETMLTRMDGFGALYQHTKQTIIPKLIDTYKDDAVDKWPTFVPPPVPTGTAANAKITMWEIGEQFEGTFHDIELGPDGLVYAVNIKFNQLVTLDPKTGATTFRKYPRGSGGAHSIELDNYGDMWTTMCGSGHMAKYDLQTKEFLVTSSAEAPAKRGSYPHTLRINPADPEGLVWYTDAGRNSCFSLHPKTLKVKEYHLLDANQAVAAGKGESRGITPYGIDYSPVDGMIWYSKLNGNRIGRIDPKTPDGNIKEWNPPFRGPRRLHVAPDGMVWVPGFGSGVIGKFDPNSEEWTVYALPDAENQIPYALNVDAQGYVWICGTHNDTLNRFDPRTEELVEFRLPNRVSYTREIEFDQDGAVWISTSGPPRHMETGYGAIIKLEVLDDQSGGIKLARVNLSDDHFAGEPPRKPNFQGSRNRDLLKRIDSNPPPIGYTGQQHQTFVDKKMAGMTSQQRSRMGELWKEKQRVSTNMKNPGLSFVKILDYAINESRKKQTNQREDPRRGKASERGAATTRGAKSNVSGVVRFNGVRPQRQPIAQVFGKQMMEQCQLHHPGVLLDENLMVGDSGGLANVFVYVKEGLAAKSYPAPNEPVVLNQDGCMFHPRVLGVQIGQDFVMKNSDPLIHNVRSMSTMNRPFNIAQPAKSPDRTKTFDKTEKAVKIACDFHPWMAAYYFVLDHPFYAVTNEQGQYKINGLPPGAYTLGAWHEEFGEREIQITVGANTASSASFSFDASDIKSE